MPSINIDTRQEAVQRCAAGIPNMIELSLFLLKQNVDPNIQNAKGRYVFIVP
jgi:hypothetical protein